MKKKLVFLGCALLLLVGAGYVLLPKLIQEEALKTYLQTAIRLATKKEVTFQGKLTLTVFPNIHLTAANLVIANPSGFQDAHFLTANQLQASIKLLPLLQKRIEIDSIHLVKPKLSLETSATNHSNWESPTLPAKNTLPKEEEKTFILPLLHKATIQDGTISYRSGGKKTVISQLNAKLSLDDEMTLYATGSLQETPFRIGLNVTEILALLSERSTALFLEWSYGAHAGEWKGKARYAQNQLRLAEGNFKVNETLLAGSLTIDLSKTLPFISGNLTINELKLSDTSKSAAIITPSLNATKKPDRIDWDPTPIDLSAAKNFNADLSLMINHFSYKKLSLNNIASTLRLQKGILEVIIPNAKLEEGTITFESKLDTNSPHFSAFNTVRLTNLPLGLVLTSLTDIKRLNGLLDSTISLKSSGNSLKRHIETLGGKGNVLIRNGTFHGINLSSLTPNTISLAYLLKQSSSTASSFDTLSASFVISNGLIENHDLFVRSPAFSILGSGTVNLPPSLLHYQFSPKTTSELTAALNETTIRVEGPLLNPGIKVDLQQMLQQLPKKLPDQLKALPKDKKQLKGLLKEQLKQQMNDQLKQFIPLPKAPTE